MVFCGMSFFNTRYYSNGCFTLSTGSSEKSGFISIYLQNGTTLACHSARREPKKATLGPEYSREFRRMRARKCDSLKDLPNLGPYDPNHSRTRIIRALQSASVKQVFPS